MQHFLVVIKKSTYAFFDYQVSSPFSSFRSLVCKFRERLPKSFCPLVSMNPSLDSWDDFHHHPEVATLVIRKSVCFLE